MLVTTIIIPAHNEADYIERCLQALLQQSEDAGALRVIVAANACTDDTVAISQTFISEFEKKGCELRVLDLPDPGKIAALNQAENALEPGLRIYLDADVICSPELVGQLRAALSMESPRYGTGRLVVAPAKSWITRAYARLWQELPFFKSGAVGAGLFAVNAQGRARWGAFPDIISDDTFVRLNFTSAERVEVAAPYVWPMIEGFTGLVKVRRRQDAGVHEVQQRYPNLMHNDTTPALGLSQAFTLFVKRPWAFFIYVCVHFTVRAKRSNGEWVRGR